MRERESLLVLPVQISPSLRNLFLLDLSSYCLSYSPLPRRFKTVNPAFLASLTETGLSFMGELNVEMTLRTGFLQAGHLVNSAAVSGRRKVNLPPQAAHLPSQSSYS